MTITLNGTTGITTPDITSSGALGVDASAPDNSLVVDSSGNVGIGTSSPTGTLDVVSPSSSLGINLRGRASDDIGTLSFYTNNGVTNNAQVQMRPADNEFRFLVGGARSLTYYTNGSERARIDSSGNFYLSGNQTMGPLTDNQCTIGDGSHRWRVIYAVNGTIQTSDGTQKTEVQPSALGLDFINALNPVSFKWIDSTYGRTHYGFIAQEIEQTLEYSNAGDFGGLVIDEMEDGSRLYGLRHHELLAPLVKAIQEQQAIIEEQKTALTALTARIEALEGATT